MGCLKGGYDVPSVGEGEFALRLVLHQRAAPLYWRSRSHTHTHTQVEQKGLRQTLQIQNPASIEQCILQTPIFFLYQGIQPVVRAESAQARVFLGRRLPLSAKFFSSQHASDMVPLSSAKIFVQETCAEYHTLSACQDEYQP
jgi:hypothetical protein